MNAGATPQRDVEWLRDILEAIEKIEARVVGGRAAFDRDGVLQDAIVRQLQIIGQATKRLSEDFRVRYPDVPWREIAGMRDVLVHDYSRVDLNAVWNVVEKELPPLKKAVEAALGELDNDRS